ncbi:hypothetical protein [Fodinibius saliphilus]|uniref:hypothetical protein n=1 Tax=Fodinibius saliphilus TaxID=1920650 RepID=UPI0011085EC2|nr:hypothetical protein [Fodinibius saliphilus]
MMGSFGGMEIFIILIIGLLPSLIVVGYFLWLATKINKIARAQEEQVQEMRKLIRIFKDEKEGKKIER